MRARVAVLALFALAVTVALAGRSGDERYRITMDLENAGGLRIGSLVQAGGIRIGSVQALDLRRRGTAERVRATLELDKGHGPIGPDARATIAAKNLLGEKFVDLDAGDRRRPLAAPARIASQRVTESVDLDQLLDVLDPGTRARLMVLINEAGAGVVGRREDFSAFVNALPPSLSKARDLLEQVSGDNTTLSELIDRSDRFIATFTQSRRELTDLVHTVGQTAVTINGRRRELRRTLAEAPTTLRSLRRLLADLRSTTTSLKLGLRQVASTAAPLDTTLAQIEPFRKAAQPTLRTATALAPQLTDLARGATPVVRQAVPTASALDAFAGIAVPLTRTLNFSIDDLMTTLLGWDRAIQRRDGVSHMFRAKVAFSVDSLRNIIARLTQSPSTRKVAKRAPAKRPTSKEAAPAKPVAPATLGKPSITGPKLPPIPEAPKVTQTVNDLLELLLGP